MIRLVEHGELEPGIESGRLHIGQRAIQTSLKGDLKEGCHQTLQGWLSGASELTDAFLGHIEGKIAIVILERVLMKPTV